MMYLVWGLAILVSVIVTVVSFVFMVGIASGIMEAVNDKNSKKPSGHDKDLEAFGRDLADI